MTDDGPVVTVVFRRKSGAVERDGEGRPTRTFEEGVVRHFKGVTKVVLGTNVVTLYYSEGTVLTVIPLDAIESITYPENLS